MDDQPGVGVRHRVADLLEKHEPRIDAQPLAVGVGRDGLAAHKLRREVGAAVRGRAAVEQARDAGVLQPRERLALGPEAKPHRLAETGTDELDGGGLRVRAGALGAPDLAHAALPHALDQAPRPGLWRRRQRRLSRETAREVAVGHVGGEKALYFLAQRHVGRAVGRDGFAVQKGRAGSGREVRGAVKYVGDAVPASRRHEQRGGLDLRHARGAARPSRPGPLSFWRQRLRRRGWAGRRARGAAMRGRAASRA